MRRDHHELLKMIEGINPTSVALCAIGPHMKTFLEKIQIPNTIYDYHPCLNINGSYENVDIIFDDVNFKEDLIVHCNVEKTYPLGKIHNGKMLLVYCNRFNNGNRSVYTDKVVDNIADDNNMIVIDRKKIVLHNDTIKYFVYGVSI